MSDENEKLLQRRQFMKMTTWVIAAFIGAGIAVPSWIYIIGSSLGQQNEEQWLPLGSTSKIEPGTPTLFKAKIQRQTGWITSEEDVSVYVLTEDKRSFIAMSNICTHLGCRVRWSTQGEQFFCPCHNGFFDKQGNVISGPPPRPLDRYPIKVDGESLLILAG